MPFLNFELHPKDLSFSKYDTKLMSKEMIKLDHFLSYLGLEKRKWQLSHRLPFLKLCMGVDLKKNEQQVLVMFCLIVLIEKKQTY